MSKKRNISYIKPEEPNFLKRIKAQIGYKEGPTVDTKREELPSYDPNDFREIDDEPLVVVLKKGDLTAEEAASEKAKLEKEKDDTPADLSERVIFRPKQKAESALTIEDNSKNSEKESVKNKSEIKKSKSKKQKSKIVLSFNEDEEENEF